MPRQVTISPIAEAHAESFHACLDAVAKERRYLAQYEAPPLERVRGFVCQNVASDAAQFVALDGPTVVGWCDILPHWPHAVKHCGTLGMAVLPGYRGQGIGRRLLDACLEKAKTKGITRVELEVRVDNAHAIKLYEKAGCTSEGVKWNALFFAGVYHDALLMSLISA